MKKDMLQVGTKDFSVSVEIEIPESLADCARLAKVEDSNISALDVFKGTGVEYIVAKFTRGYRIDLQEGGARATVVEMLGGKSGVAMGKDPEFVAKVKTAVEEEIKGFDPAAPRARGGRKAVVQAISIDAGKTYTAAELQALLSTLKGVTVISA